MDNINTYEYFKSDFTKEELEEFRKYNNKYIQQTFIKSINLDISRDRMLVEIYKDRVRELVNKEDYTKKDSELVRLYLQVIKYTNKSISESYKELLDLLKYPIGSDLRPALILHKGGEYGRQ